jgi:hypothetical protein
MAENEVNINFRGTPEYRQTLQLAALTRKIKVQALIERALDAYLSVPSTERTSSKSVLQTEQDISLTPRENGAIVHESGQITEKEREFLRECLRIYRSEFGRPLVENVTFFGIGLSAVEAIAAMRSGDERAPADATALSAGERRAFAIADHAENEAHLLKAATSDVVEELRRARAGDKGPSGGTDSRRKSRSRKTGSGSGD